MGEMKKILEHILKEPARHEPTGFSLSEATK
jgi:hypothetical protein